MHDRIIQKAASEGWTDLEVINGQVWGYCNTTDVMPQPYETGLPSRLSPAQGWAVIEQTQRIFRSPHSCVELRNNLRSIGPDLNLGLAMAGTRGEQPKRLQIEYSSPLMSLRETRGSATLIIDGEHMQGLVTRFQSGVLSCEHFHCNRIPTPLIGKLEDRYRINDPFEAELIIDRDIEHSGIRNVGILNFSINFTCREIIASTKIAILSWRKKQ